MPFSGNEIHSDSPYWPLVVRIPTGHRNAKSLKQLAEELGMGAEEIRGLVRGARLDGFLICDTSDGYFVPERKYEFQRWYREQLRELNSLSRILQLDLWALM